MDKGEIPTFIAQQVYILSNDSFISNIREMIIGFTSEIEEKKMFGGLCFMVKGKICVAVSKTRLMFRLDPGEAELYTAAGECSQMIHNGRKMPGFVFVDYDSFDSKKKLKLWVDRSLEYNQHAKESLKKKNN